MDLNYIEQKNLKNEWLESRPRHTMKDLLEIFPEMLSAIPDKVKELKDSIREEEIIIDKLRKIVEESDLNSFDRYFYNTYIKVFHKSKVDKLNKEVVKFERMNYSYDRTPSNGVSEDDVERAKQEPIENFLLDRLQRFGGKHRCHCPLHTENTPSFYVYKKNNSFYCFGCKKGGDVITLIRYLNDCSFIDAVKYILRK